jgi:hypothetical protein
MPLLFKSKDLRPVLVEALTNQCRLILVKDRGVYFMSEKGERRADGRWKRIAYAVGCNPEVDPFDDWWHRANSAFGGDDFGEFLDPREGVFAHLLQSEDDLRVSATATHLNLQATPSRKKGR